MTCKELLALSESLSNHIYRFVALHCNSYRMYANVSVYAVSLFHYKYISSPHVLPHPAL